jgi:DNA-binding NarL/FixJ family response regulator
MLKPKILIADDHAMIRDGIKALLKDLTDAELVGEAITGSEAVDRYRLLQPDLVIMDISMPEVNGMEAARQILEEDPDAYILMLSMYEDEDYIIQCMDYGVKGFVVKSETGSELGVAIKTVLNGGKYLSKKVQEVIVGRYTNSHRKQKSAEIDVKLTSREIEIMKLIADGHQMAEKLFISPRTVETHRANLMKKTNARNVVDLIKKIDQLGILK